MAQEFLGIDILQKIFSVFQGLEGLEDLVVTLSLITATFLILYWNFLLTQLYFYFNS